MKTIAVMYDKNLKPETEYPAKNAVDYIKNFCNVTVNPKIFNVNIDAVIVYGGDGLLLHTANKAASSGIPIIGINYGRVGYLCKVGRNEHHKSIIDKIVNKNYSIESRTRILAEIKDSHITEAITALNEISVGGIDKTVYLNTIIKQPSSKPLKLESVGDGVIFATKTGSTAYNVNAGGAILLSDAFSVVANNSMFKSDDLPLNTKSLITDVCAQFEIVVTNTKEGNLPYLIADGQRRRKLTKDDKVIIKKDYYDTKFMKFDY